MQSPRGRILNGYPFLVLMLSPLMLLSPSVLNAANWDHNTPCCNLPDLIMHSQMFPEASVHYSWSKGTMGKTLGNDLPAPVTSVQGEGDLHQTKAGFLV